MTLNLCCRDSGKSTLLKQLSLLLSGTFCASEREQFRSKIYRFIVDSAQAICRGFETLQIPIPQEIRPMVDVILGYEVFQIVLETQRLDPELTDAIYYLWVHPVMKTIKKRYTRLHLSESTDQ